MSRYARGTDVSTEQSEAEIKRTIARYGGDDVVTGISRRSGIAFVQFRYRDLSLEMRVPLPSYDDDRFHTTPSGRRRRNSEAARAEWDRACRQQWRVLALLIKANLEATDNGLVEPKELFLPWLLLPSGETVGSAIRPKLDEMLASGKVPKTVFALPKGKEEKA